MSLEGRQLNRLVAKLVHILYGILTALAPTHLAPILAAVFIIYELDEDWHLNDQAYRDLLEYMVGLSIGALSLLALKAVFLR